MEGYRDMSNEHHNKELSRRTFLQQSALAGTAAVAAGAGMGSLGAEEAATPPNIIFVLTDDQAPWALGASGNPDVHTPTMDRLFSEGATFTNSFVTTPVCSPSRVGFLSSRYGTEVGITDWISPSAGKNRTDETELGLDPSLPTWVRALAENGYHTGLVGKWHLGKLDKYHPTKYGYKHFAGFREGGMKVENPKLEINGELQECKGLTVDVLTNYAIEYLHANRWRPFMLSLHYRSPHAPWLPAADEDKAPYEDRDLTLPEYPDLDTERVEKLMRQYLTSVTGVDNSLRRVLATLDELGLTGNTIIIYTSDHGYNIGHHGIIHKGNARWITNDARGKKGGYGPDVTRSNMFDTSLRVPTAIRWPGVIEPGTVIDETVSNLDWFPTILALAGLEPPEGATIHGKNLVPLLNNYTKGWDNDLYGEYSQHHYTTVDLRMYRTPKWKLVRDFKNEGHDELYNLEEDPEETTNLIDDAGSQRMREKLDAMMLARMRELNDPVLR